MLDKIGKFIKNNALTIVLAIVPPAIIWFGFQRESSDLSVTVTSKSSIVSLDAAFSDGIEIFHNKKPINALYVAVIEIHNEGNKPIEKKDFDTPIQLKFNGNVISPVATISRNPKNLIVTYTINKNIVLISPLLLNPDDSFVIGVKIADLPKGDLKIDAEARIKGIKNLSFSPYSDSKETYKLFVIGAITAFLIIVSLLATKILTSNIIDFAKIMMARARSNKNLANELESKASIVKRVATIADRLDISRHDFKSNLLLFRLKIEGQLRELIRLRDVPSKANIGSIRKLSEILLSHGFIDNKIVALIRDISPAMNRELHESSSYLSDEEYEFIQNAALSVIASLDEMIEEALLTKNQKASELP